MRELNTRVKRLARSVFKPFRGSANYWEERYRAGGTSGAGSYNRLALFKAEIINNFVASHHVKSVIEFGSGDGAQLALADYPQYLGVDVAATAIEMTRKRFAADSTKKFALPGDLQGETAELALSLDVIYHLVEDDTFDHYMRRLFDAATRYVIVYASNENKPWPDQHVRHRNFTSWVDQYAPQFSLTERIPNRYPYDAGSPDDTSFSDFYIFARSSSAPDRLETTPLD